MYIYYLNERDIIAQSTANLYSKMYKKEKEKNHKNKQLKIMFFLNCVAIKIAFLIKVLVWRLLH